MVSVGRIAGLFPVGHHTFKEIWTDSEREMKMVGKLDLLGKTEKIFLPNKCLTEECCLLANMKKVAAQRTGLFFLCFEQN